MAERDVVVQLKPSEARLLLLTLRSSQELLDMTAEFIPSVARVAEDRTQQLSKLRSLMHRIHEAPTTDEYTPREVGGVVLARAPGGQVIAWGPNMEYITGWSEDEMRGQRYWVVMGLADTRAEAFLDQLRGDMVINQEMDIPTKWGKHTRVFARAEFISEPCVHEAVDEFILCHVWPV